MKKRQDMQSTEQQKTIGVMIVDDYEAVRTGLATFLEAFDDLCLVAQAGSGGEALRLCQELEPDVVLLDLGLSTPDSIETIRALRRAYPEVQVIAMSSYEDQDRSAEALCSGAADCLRKDAHIETLAEAIRKAGQKRRESVPSQSTSVHEGYQGMNRWVDDHPLPGKEVPIQDKEV